MYEYATVLIEIEFFYNSQPTALPCVSVGITVISAGNTLPNIAQESDLCKNIIMFVLLYFQKFQVHVLYIQ
jgi:hypothetical protein